MGPSLRCDLRTTVDETVNRLALFANGKAWVPEWKPARSVVLLWESDDRFNAREPDDFHWKLFTIRVTRTADGSRVVARARCRKWIPAAPVAGFVFALLCVFCLLATGGQVNRQLSMLRWASAACSSAIPLFVYLRQRREAARQLGDLAVSLSDIVAEPPVERAAAEGPYR